MLSYLQSFGGDYRMKIGGVQVNRCEEVLVLPRPKTEPLVFKAHAVLDMDEFFELCPKPTTPQKITPNGKEDNVTAAHIVALTKWGERRYQYILLKTLEPSNIEWETVDMAKPSTWGNWIDEFKNAGLADSEINRVQQLVLDANSLNEAKLKAAREAFLLGQGKEA